MREMFGWYLQQMLAVIPMHFNTTFSPSSHRGAHFRKFLVSLESPDRQSLLVAVIPLSYWSALNTPRSSAISTAKNTRRLRSGDRAGQLNGPPRPIHSSPNVWFRCCLTMRRICGDVLSCMNHMCCWWRGTCSYGTGKSFTKNRGYTAPVRL
jgi:hypothetical protein